MANIDVCHLTPHVTGVYIYSELLFDRYLINLVSSESIMRQIVFLAMTLLVYSVPIWKSHNFFDVVLFRIHNYSDRFQVWYS